MTNQITTERFRELWEIVKSENKIRRQVIESDEYKEKENQIKRLTQEMQNILSEISDHSPQLKETEKELLKYFKDNNIYDHYGIYSKTSSIGEVSVERVIEVMRDRPSELKSLFKINQNTIKEKIKEYQEGSDSDKEKAELLKNCIVKTTEVSKLFIP